MTHPAARESYRLEESLWRRGRNAILAVGVLGWTVTIYGFLTDAEQTYASYLVAFMFFLSIAWGATFFVMIQHVTSAAWSVTVRRLMENLMFTMPAMALLFVPIAIGMPTLYEWGTPGFINAEDPNLQFKALFFSRAFFLGRSVIYFLVWTVLALTLYGNSVAQDAAPNRAAYENTRRWSGPGLLVLTITVTMAAVDWMMSLDPFWYSTIFGIYVFSGGGLAFFAALVVIALMLRRWGCLSRTIHLEHYHDLGKWTFALTVWWAYIAFSQYMLIWYGDLPEETEFYHARAEGSWLWVSAALVVGRFLVPFAVLMSRSAKRKLRVLGFAAVWVLLFHFVDLHWLVMPSVHPGGFHLHWMDAATMAAVGSYFAMVFWGRLRHQALVPAGDLRLDQALAHQNT